MSKSIWIYSDERISHRLSVSHRQSIGEIKLTFFSNLQEIILRLNGDQTDLVIIDSRTDQTSQALSDFLNLCVSNKIPVLFHELHNGQQLRLDEILPYTSSKPGKLVLRRTQSEDKAFDKSNLDIVHQTAATLGHEINNPLMAISANIEMILNSNENLPESIEKKIRQIDQAARRIRSVTDNLINLENLKFRETAAGHMIQFEEKDEPELVECLIE